MYVCMYVCVHISSSGVPRNIQLPRKVCFAISFPGAFLARMEIMFWDFFSRGVFGPDGNYVLGFLFPGRFWRGWKLCFGIFFSRAFLARMSGFSPGLFSILFFLDMFEFCCLGSIFIFSRRVLDFPLGHIYDRLSPGCFERFCPGMRGLFSFRDVSGLCQDVWRGCLIFS